MKNSIWALAVVAMLFSCKNAEDKALDTTSADSTAVNDETAESSKPLDSAAMMRAWTAYMTPGEVHKALASDVGKWNCTMTFWEGPGAEAEKAESKAEIKMAFGGKYQEAYYTGDMMGMPFEGKSVMGYNNASGKVFSTWYDNMGTGMMIAEGDYDSAAKKFKVSGEMTDPMTKKSKKFREEYTIVDQGTRRMSMFDQAPGGGEYKSMEIVMTRAE